MYNKIKVLVLGAVVFLFVSSLVATSAAAPSTGANGCLTVAYTADYQSNLFTLAGNNSTMVGNDIIIITDCGEFYVLFDGQNIGGSEKSFTFSIPTGDHSLEIIGNNWSVSYYNLHIFSGSEVYVGEYNLHEEVISISSTELVYDEIIAHGVTAFALYILSTTLVYRVARYRVDRACEVMI